MSPKKAPAAAELDWRQVLAWRLDRQHLLDRVNKRSMIRVAERLCCLHAQLMSSAELALWARVDGLKRTDVANALWKKRSLVKMWAMRGTLHLVPATEFGTWQGALDNYDNYTKAHWLRYFDITRAQLEKLTDAIGDALHGKELTREELIDEVRRITRSKAQAERLRSGWGTFLKPPSFQGKLCFAPGEGQRVRFTNPETWLDGFESRDPQEALVDVVRRYLGVFGPASNADLARWWSGFTPPQARRMLESIEDAVEVDVDGLRRWMLAEHLDEIAGASVERSVRLLPMFDQYVVGSSRDAEAVVSNRFKPLVFRKSAWISAVILVDGRIEGVWKHEVKGKRVLVTLEPFEKLPRWAGPLISDELDSFAAFLGKELEVAKV